MKIRNKKTGKNGQLNSIIFDVDYDTEIDVEILLTDSDGETINKSFRSLDELKQYLDEWKDYVPKEPIIKDENIRKAVKVWAYVNSVETATYDELPCDRGLNIFLFEDYEKENANIQFYGWIPTLKEGEIHTIAELCGEEE